MERNFEARILPHADRESKRGSIDSKGQKTLHRPVLDRRRAVATPPLAERGGGYLA